MSTFYKLVIKNIIRQTPNAITLDFQVPVELQQNYQFTAGQYVNLKLTLNNQEIRRAYSINSSPFSNQLQVTIKSIKNGTFSKFANTQLVVGNILEVSEPEGKFTLEPKPEQAKNYIAFAAGSGITPIISIIKSTLEKEKNSTFTLVYGNKNKAETIFFSEINELQNNHIGQFNVHYVFSQIKENNADFGRIDQTIVSKYLQRELYFNDYFICGPEAMIEIVMAELKRKNVADKNIKFELFTTNKAENKVETLDSNAVKLTVLVDHDTFEFEMNAKQTILEAALKQGIDVPYSCQGGICSSCIARIKNGTAQMKKNSILTDSEIAEGLILTCQAHATSGAVLVDYDDV